MPSLSAIGPMLSSTLLSANSPAAVNAPSGAEFGRELQRARETQAESAPPPSREPAPTPTRPDAPRPPEAPRAGTGASSTAAADERPSAEEAPAQAGEAPSRKPATPARKDVRHARGESRDARTDRAGDGRQDAEALTALRDAAPAAELPDPPAEGAATAAAEGTVPPAATPELMPPAIAAEGGSPLDGLSGDRQTNTGTGIGDAVQAAGGRWRATASRGGAADSDAVRAPTAELAADAAPDAGGRTIGSGAFDSLLGATLAAAGNAQRPGTEGLPAGSAPALASPTLERTAAAIDSSAPAQATTATLDEPVGSEGFAGALGARVAILAREGLEQARLNVHPAELGPIALRLALDGTQVRVDMSAEVASTRQALEQALPELASALRDAGFTLTGGGVFHQAPGEHREPPAFARVPETGARADGPAERSAPAPARTVERRGLVDLYA